MADRDRLEAKLARLLAIHFKWRRSWMTAHRLHGCRVAIEAVRDRINAIDNIRKAA